MRFAIMLWLMVLASLATNAESQVSFHIGCYNSYDDMSVDLMGKNFDFGSKTILEPDSIKYKNGGGSTERECSYSFKMALNGDELASGASTNSGAFSWNAEILADHGKENSGEAFSLSAKHVVKNGILESCYGTSNFKSEGFLETTDAIYLERVEGKSNDIRVSGKGLTIPDPPSQTSTVLPSATPSESPEYVKLNVDPKPLAYQEATSALTSPDDVEPPADPKHLDDAEPPADPKLPDETKPLTNPEPKIKGFTQTITTSQNGKSGKIATNILGDTEAVWNNGIKAEQASHSFGVNLEGSSKSSMEKLSMEGEATGISKQSLPPGKIVVDVEEAEDPLKESLEEISKYIEKEYGKFQEDYPEDPSLESWYLLNQKTYVNPIDEKDYQGSYNSPVEYYRMKMGFSVGLK